MPCISYMLNFRAPPPPPGFEVLTGISKDGLDIQLLLLYICWISGRCISGGDNQSEKTTQATT